MKVIDSLVTQAAHIAAIRRDIHAHPELSFEELRTSDVVAAKLTEWGIEVHRGLGKTGVVGILKNGTSDRAIGLRADMDALPMQEFNQFAHASQHAGKMHACGHDGHVAMLLAAAQHLSKHKHFDGTVYFIFQPAEEGGGGAREMIKDGLFTKFPMQAVFGMHNWPGMAVGKFAVSAGPVMASSNEFKILESHIKDALLHKTTAFRTLLDSLAHEGILHISVSEREATATHMVVMLTWWLSYEYVRDPRHALEPESAQKSLLRGAKHVLGLLTPYAEVAHKAHLQMLLTAY
jgi:hypothetical protein